MFDLSGIINCPQSLGLCTWLRLQQIPPASLFLQAMHILPSPLQAPTLPPLYFCLCKTKISIYEEMKGTSVRDTQKIWKMQN